MTMTEFYKTYNLNPSYFAAIAGVGKRTLDKYSEGKLIAEQSEWHIKTAIAGVEKYGKARPNCDTHGLDQIDQSRLYRNQQAWFDAVCQLISEERA